MYPPNRLPLITLDLIHSLKESFDILYPWPKNFHGRGHHIVKIFLSVIMNDSTFGKNSVYVVINISNQHNIENFLLFFFGVINEMIIAIAKEI